MCKSWNGESQKRDTSIWIRRKRKTSVRIRSVSDTFLIIYHFIILQRLFFPPVAVLFVWSVQEKRKDENGKIARMRRKIYRVWENMGWEKKVVHRYGTREHRAFNTAVHWVLLAGNDVETRLPISWRRRAFWSSLAESPGRKKSLLNDRRRREWGKTENINQDQEQREGEKGKRISDGRLSVMCGNLANLVDRLFEPCRR